MEKRSTARRRAGLTGLAAALLLAGSLLAGLPAAAKTDAPAPLIDLIQVENGTKDALDGGVYTAVALRGQTFGVLYGSPEHPLSAVTLFTVFSRSLGTATVRDADSGRVLARSVTLPVATLVAQRLDAAFEFRDLNGDGIFNFRPNLGTRDPFDFNASEPLVKGASLAGDWNLTAFELKEISADEVRLTLVLTLEDARYRLPFDAARTGDGVLNKVEFTVNVVISRERIEGAEVPHFAAQVRRTDGRRELVSLEPDGTQSASYTATRAVFKVDHDIVGWDFAPPSEAVESRLMLHTTVLFANGVERRLAPWLTDLALAGTREAAANISDDHANLTVSRDRPLSEFRTALNVGLRDSWGAAGRLGWVPTAKVWAEAGSPEATEERVKFQVLGGAPFGATVDGRAFRGFVLSGGYVYPDGYRIYHDPQLEAQSVELEGNSLLPAVLPALILIGEALLVVGALAGLLFLLARAASGSARVQAADEARRLEALKARYKLPDPSAPARPGGE